VSAPTPEAVLVRSRAATLTVVAPSSVTPTDRAPVPNIATPLNVSVAFACS